MSIETQSSPKLILASRSPRRRSMLEEAGIVFDVAVGVDDGGLRPGEVDAAHWVASLAFLKAWSVASGLGAEPHSIVLGADTVCESRGELLGQPADAEAARQMLTSFMDGSHRVLSGVAIVSPDGRRELLVDEARVVWGSVSDHEIDTYIDSGGWRGKAGGYSLSERIDAGWPIQCEGDPATVMGLPMQRLPERLLAWNITPDPDNPAGSAA